MFIKMTIKLKRQTIFLKSVHYFWNLNSISQWQLYKLIKSFDLKPHRNEPEKALIFCHFDNNKLRKLSICLSDISICIFINIKTNLLVNHMSTETCLKYKDKMRNKKNMETELEKTKSGSIHTSQWNETDEHNTI